MFFRKPVASSLGRHDHEEEVLVAEVRRHVERGTAVALCAYRTYMVSDQEEFPGRVAVSPRIVVPARVSENTIRYAVQKVLEYRSAKEKRTLAVEPIAETASS